MGTFNGQTLSEYQTAHGFSVSSYAYDYSTAYAAVTGILTPGMEALLGKSVAKISSTPIGLIETRDFIPPEIQESAKGLGDTYQAGWKKRSNTALSIVKDAQFIQAVGQKDAHKLADLNIQNGTVGLETSLKDRTRTDEVTQQTAQHVWQSAESVLDRTAASAFLTKQLAAQTIEKGLDRAVKLTDLKKQLNIDYLANSTLETLNSDRITYKGRVSETNPIGINYTGPFGLALWSSYNVYGAQMLWDDEAGNLKYGCYFSFFKDYYNHYHRQPGDNYAFALPATIFVPPANSVVSWVKIVTTYTNYPSGAVYLGIPSNLALLGTKTLAPGSVTFTPNVNIGPASDLIILTIGIGALYDVYGSVSIGID